LCFNGSGSGFHQGPAPRCSDRFFPHPEMAKKPSKLKETDFNSYFLSKIEQVPLRRYAETTLVIVYLLNLSNLSTEGESL